MRRKNPTEVDKLFDACGGDFYLTVYAAVQLYLLNGGQPWDGEATSGRCSATTRKRRPCQRSAIRNGLCPSHQHLAPTREVAKTEELVAA